MTVMLTGVAGFIGFHTCQKLLDRGDAVVGIDNMNGYYDVSLKEARLARLIGHPNFTFYRVDIADRAAMFDIAARHPSIDRYINLAAQAGVRYSLEAPHEYSHANVEGHLVMLELARNNPRLRHFVYASSSSVYGANSKLPFSEDDRVDHPVSLYAATKRAGELMSHCYAHLYRLPTTGLRFFTVYGPWGRPDMAAYLFARAITAGEPIKVFNNGNLRRDFTYIDDIVSGVVAVLDRPPPVVEGAVPARLYNIGNNRSEALLDFIAEVVSALGREATFEFLPMQPGDVHETYADISALARDAGYAPTTPISVGIPKFIQWFKAFHKLA